LNILTFPVKIESGKVLVELPAMPELDAILGTHGLRVQKSDCVDIAGDAIKTIKIPSSQNAFMKNTTAVAN